MQDSTGAFELTANRMCVVCCAWCYFSLGDTSSARVLSNSRILLLLAHQFSSFLSSVWAKASMKQRWTQLTDAEICWNMLKYAEYAEGRNMTRLGPFQNHPSTAAVPFWRRRQVFCAKVFADGTSEAKLARLHLRQRDFRGYGIYGSQMIKRYQKPCTLVST